MRELWYVVLRLGCIAAVMVEVVWTAYAFHWIHTQPAGSAQEQGLMMSYWFVSQGILFPLAALSTYVFFTQEY